MKSQGWFQRTHNTSNQTENMLYKGSVSWTQSNIFHLSLPKQNKNKIKKISPKQAHKNKKPETNKQQQKTNPKEKLQKETILRENSKMKPRAPTMCMHLVL